MPINLASYVEPVAAIAEAAGALILSFYRSGQAHPRLKADSTPVTDADMAAHHYIVERLRQLASHPIVSEEAPPGQQPITSDYYWLVDPLDGTKEFIAETDEFTVNIALIQAGFPVLGVIHVPVSGHLYYGHRGGGAFRRTSKETKNHPIKTRILNPSKFRYLVSRRHGRHSLDAFQAAWPGCLITPVGSSLKFCWIAEGSADLHIRRGPTSEWDTAAAQCILEEAGGRLLTLHGERLAYNKPHPINPDFIACGDPLFPLARLLNPDKA